MTAKDFGFREGRTVELVVGVGGGDLGPVGIGIVVRSDRGGRSHQQPEGEDRVGGTHRTVARREVSRDHRRHR